MQTLVVHETIGWFLTAQSSPETTAQSFSTAKRMNQMVARIVTSLWLNTLWTGSFIAMSVITFSWTVKILSWFQTPGDDGLTRSERRSLSRKYDKIMRQGMKTGIASRGREELERRARARDERDV